MAHPERIKGNKRISLLEEMEEMTVDNAIAKNRSNKRTIKSKKKAFDLSCCQSR